VTAFDHGDGVYSVIGGPFPLCNTLVVLGDELTVIDPGCAIEDLRVFLHAQNRELRNIDTVILTHIHPDHITHAVRLNRLSRCRIAANEITAPLFDRKEDMKRFLGFVPGHPIRPHWEDLVNKRMYGALEEGSVDEVLRNHDKFALGNLTLEVMYTPGHTADHMCIEITGSRRLILGADIDCTEFGPFYGHPTSSITDFRHSIAEIKERNYDALISGHLKQPEVKDYRAALTAYDRQFDLREELVCASIGNGATSVDEITRNPLIYPSLANVVYLQFEKWMIEKHVQSLLEKDLVIKQQDRLSPA